MVTPIFIFSMPRSGSTLLQKILSSHQLISSSGEPSIMLPITYILKEEGIITDSAHRENLGGIKALIGALPKKEEDYYKYLRQFILSIYSNVSNDGSHYFLDKTPKYWMIIDEIVKVFPDAKFIFLFRNPTEVLASSINTWSQDRLRVNSYIDELYDAPIKLLDGYCKHKDRSLLIRYKDLILKSEEVTSEICNYLEIEYDSAMIEHWNSTKLNGDFGDPSGVRNYKSISPESLKKWKQSFTTSFRKLLVKHYLKSIPPEFFELAGYNRTILIDEINKIPTTGLGIRDFFEYSISISYLYSNLKFFRKRYSDLNFRKLG
jgi:hypothetical protein